MPQAPAEGFARALDDLETIVASCRAADDRSGYFAAMYARVTAAVQHRASTGRFSDTAGMGRFVDAFARRYTDAYRARASGEPTTRSWEVAFDAASTSGPLVLQHLALGMNAHINLDLGIVAAERARGSSLQSLSDDFLAINAVLGELVDRCQDALVAASPVMGLVDDLLDTHDEGLARFSLEIARDRAWDFAAQLDDAPTREWPALIGRRDEAVAAFGERLITRAGPADTARRLLRLTERRTVADTIDLLMAVDVS